MPALPGLGNLARKLEALLATMERISAAGADLSCGLEDLATWSGIWRHSSPAMEPTVRLPKLGPGQVLAR